MAQTYKIKEEETYKSKTSLQAQIAGYAKELFKDVEQPDTIDLLPNIKVHFGSKMNPKERKKGYCSIQDYRKYNLNIYDIDIAKALNELDPFLEDEQNTLDRWNQ